MALGKEQQAAIEKKGKDTLATIPDDYTQVSNDVSQLKEATAKLKDGKISKFYASSQGNTNLPDSDDGRIVDLVLYGKSEQKQYSGKNLLNATLQTTTENGVTCTNNGDGTYTVNGTVPDGMNAYFSIVKSFTAKAGKKYKLVGCPAGGDMDAKYALFYRDNWRLDVGNGSTFTQAEDATNYVSIKICGGFTANNLVFKPMLVDADTYPDTSYNDYEPYVGGIPSPNPEYPQEIKSVVKPSVKVCGKNLLNLPDKSSTDPPINYEINKGIVTFSGTLTSGYSNIILSEYTIPADGEYTISTNSSTPGKDSPRLIFSVNGGAYESAMPSKSKTFSAGDNVLVAARISDVGNYDGAKIAPMIEKSSTATDYQPYTEQTATLPYTLNAIPVTSGGNVTIDGQQYIADYVDVEKGKLVRMVDSSKLDTTQSIIGKTDWLLATPTETDLTADEIAAFKALVSHYPVTNVSTTSDQLDGYAVFNYPISLANGWNYVKQQLGDTRDYLYGIDLMTAEAYVNSEYAAALAEIEV